MKTLIETLKMTLILAALLIGVVGIIALTAPVNNMTSSGIID